MVQDADCAGSMTPTNRTTAQTNRRAGIWIAAACVVVIALIMVGGAHWRIRDLETGDVVWDAQAGRNLNAEGSILVEDDRVYIFSYQTLTIFDFDSGKKVAEDFIPDTNTAFVGDGGQIAVAGREDIALFTKDGEELWRHEMDVYLFDPIAMSRSGDLTAIECRSSDRCTMVHLDPSGRQTRAPTSIRRATGVTIDNNTDTMGQMGGARDVVRLPTIAAAVTKDRAFQVRDGKTYGAPVRTMRDDQAIAQVGDLLVGLARTGSTCTFDAVRDGEPEWTTTTECPEIGFPELTVHANRLYVTDHNYAEDGHDGYDVITTDLEGRRATSFTVDTKPPLEHTQRKIWATPDAVVVADTDHVTSYSPEGKQLWSEDLPCRYIESTDGSRRWRACEHVRVTGNRVIRQTENDGASWSAMAIGDDLPPETLTFINPTTGKTTARFAPEQAGAAVYSTGDGHSVVTAYNYRVWLIRP